MIFRTVKNHLVRGGAAGMCIFACTLCAVTPAWAGQWVQQDSGWKYLQDDGTACQNSWNWIDGRCYCFDAAGRMYAGTVTPDGYTVDASGAWTVNGVVQVQNHTAADGWSQIASEVDEVDPDAFAESLLYAVNRERDDNNRDWLLSNKYLDEAAKERACEIADAYGHTRPDGSSWTTVLEEQEITCSRWGENIAAGQADAQTVVDQWMDSAGHKENLLDKRFEEAGSGCYYENGVLYWVMLFTD